MFKRLAAVLALLARTRTGTSRRPSVLAAATVAALLLPLAAPGGGLAAGAGQVAPSPQAVAGPPEIAGGGGSGAGLAADDEESAAALASSTGEPVEISSMTTSSTRTLALPDGTYQLEAFSGPVRVRRQGGWVPIDMTLTVTEEGELRPQAAPVDMTFSLGGTDPFALLRQGDYQYGLHWPAALPEPTISGDTATYANVSLGGGVTADLTVTALKTGFTHNVVLRQRPAAPVEIRLPLVVSGDVDVTESGGLAMFDATGQQVAAAPTPLMWDSSLDPELGESARSANVDVDVLHTPAGPELVLRPDPDFLADPSLIYPVVIDPTTTLWSSDTWVQNTYQNTPQGGSSELKAGHWSSYTARSYLKFSLGSIVGKDIIDADLTLYSYYTSSCTKGSGLQVRRVTSSYSVSTVVWGTQPSTTTSGAVTNTSRHGYSSSCPANYMSWDIDTIVRAWAGGSANHGVRIAAVDESDNHTWTRFYSANKYSGQQHTLEPRLTIKWNTRPQAPTASSLSSKPGGTCSTNSAAPRISSTTQPALTAVLKDADDRVGAVFEWYLGSTKKGGATIAPVTNSAISSGYPFTATIPSGHFADNQVIKWRVQAKDDHTTSAWSPWCYLEVDTTSPRPPGVSSSRYPDDGVAHDGVGRWGYFDFTAGSSDVVAYEYTFPGEAPLLKNASGEGGPARVVWTPMRDGPFTLEVRSKDDAGRWSSPTAYTFLVKAGAAPVAQWKLDDGQGTTASGTPGGCISTCPAATLGPGAAWTTGGRVDGALQLDGSTGDYASTAGPLVNTTNSFTVSAWARLDQLSAGNVVTQQGTNVHVFALYYSGTYDNWAFGINTTDTNSPACVCIGATGTIQTGAWAHLTGVYDNGANLIHLYVNGKLAGTKSVSIQWNATGPFHIGRGWYNGAYNAFFRGRIDEVRVYNRVLTPEEITQLVASTAVLRTHWSFDQETSGTSPNRVTGGAAATLRNGASLNTGDPEFSDFFGASDLMLDAAGEYADATGNAVETDDSYSVLAWAKPYKVPIGTERATVLSRSGSSGGSRQFWLGAMVAGDGVARWALAMSPTSTGGSELVVWSDEPVVEHEMVHLALTYNALDRKVTLYVNGSCSRWDPATGQTMQPCLAAAVPATFTATSPIDLGRVRVSATEGRDYFVGEIDEVRLYTGVVSRTELQQRQTSA